MKEIGWNGRNYEVFYLVFGDLLSTNFEYLAISIFFIVIIYSLLYNDYIS
jgi:hypothetical protein